MHMLIESACRTLRISRQTEKNLDNDEKKPQGERENPVIKESI